MCGKDTDFCDQGFGTDLQNGCNDLLNPQDDSLWNQYSGSCFFNDIDPSFYDKSCCLSSVISGFNIYQSENSVDYVFVY
ncbi:MAG: hypothetical protein C0594_13675 [Marinilabiliales bacterium]|nr:MAG: hypothetical protein C0594_13675 [Marinilabiliales bacterium]